MSDLITFPESVLNDSRLAPSSSGSAGDRPICTQPTSAQKWWVSIILGFIFALVSSPLAYSITSGISTGLGGLPLTIGSGPTLAGLLIQTIIFILIVRIILW